jgi:hypothetical protein
MNPETLRNALEEQSIGRITLAQLRVIVRAAADAWKLDKLAIVGLTYDRDRLAEDVRSLRKRLEAAESEVRDWRDSAETVASEVCPTDEKHCGCVLGLRTRLEAAEKELAGIALVSKGPHHLMMFDWVGKLRFIHNKAKNAVAALAGEEKP